MTKEETARLIVRATGVVFLVLAVIQLPKLITTIVYVIYLFPDLREIFEAGSSPDQSVTQIASTKTVQTTLTGAVSHFIIYLIAAWYLIRGGKFIESLLLR